jgi:competence protein ComEC
MNGGLRIKSAYLGWADAQSINNSSIVVAYEYGGVLVIFSGDIEDSGWQKLLEKNPQLFGDLLEAADTVILVAPHHGRESGYSQSMIDYFKPDLIVISDGFGAGETDPRFRSCAAGLEVKGEQKKFVTTKTKGRKRILISESGELDIHEAD